MIMFLTIVLASVPVLLVCCLAAAGLSRQEKKLPQAVLEPETRLAPSQFFGTVEVQRGASQLPIEVLLAQIENHVRLEQAAAESFLNLPTRELLHSRSTLN